VDVFAPVATRAQSTNMNAQSSRSHTVFRVTIESRANTNDDDDEEDDVSAVLVAQLNLVDLAGSERVGKTGASGDRLNEAANINKSLLSLGNVIGKLSDGVAGAHIPYRDSKLTRILQVRSRTL